MKKIIIFLGLMLTMISSVFAFSGSGAGTSGDPYIITTQSELAEMNDDLTAYYQLANDITLVGEWTTIGGGENWDTFTGGFDGGGFTIYDMDINPTIACEDGNCAFGFIGYGDFVWVKNVTFSNADISNPSDLISYVGIIVGEGDGGVISDIKIVDSNINVDGGVVGGAVGYAYGLDIIRVSVENTDIIANWRSGGVVGLAAGDFDELSFNGGSVYCLNDTPSWSACGGLVGEFHFSGQPTTIDNSYFDGTITALHSVVGAIGGQAQPSASVTLTNAYFKDSNDLDVMIDDLVSQTTCSGVYFDTTLGSISGGCLVGSATGIDLTSEVAFSSFDFVDIWQMDTYPILQSEVSTPEVVVEEDTSFTGVHTPTGDVTKHIIKPDIEEKEEAKPSDQKQIKSIEGAINKFINWIKGLF